MGSGEILRSSPIFGLLINNCETAFGSVFPLSTACANRKMVYNSEFVCLCLQLCSTLSSERSRVIESHPS